MKQALRLDMAIYKQLLSIYRQFTENKRKTQAFRGIEPTKQPNSNTSRTEQLTNNSTMTTNELTTALQDLNPSEHLIEPKLPLESHQANGNGNEAPVELKSHLSVSTDDYFKREREWLLKLASRMRRAAVIESSNALLETTVIEVREHLKADRVLIYRFESETKGDVLAESLTMGYTPSAGELLPALLFGTENKTDYYQKQVVILDRPSQDTATPYQIQLLKRFQVESSLSLPILIDRNVWGLLVVQQCSGSRVWQEAEINLLYQITVELTLNLQPAELYKQQRRKAELDKAAGKVVAQVLTKILHVLDVPSVFRSATKELRLQLQCDRVAIYRFNRDWSGEFIAESVGPDWVPLVGPDIKKVWADTHLQETQGGRYRNEETMAVNNIYTADLTQCHIDLLEQFEAKAYAIAPIFEGDKLWGLLAAFQNSGSRQWEDAEITMLALVGRQFGVALQQAEYLEQLQGRTGKLVKTAERERAITRLIEKMRQTIDMESIFNTATKEIRRLLGVERITIYKFRDNYFGDFIYESEAGGWPKLVGSGWEDSYLSEHQGGRFRNNEPYIAEDVYKANLTECHLEVLEHFGVKSFAIVAIFQGTKLWGLLSAFQHSSSRYWEEDEVKLLMQIAAQLGVALQQTNYLQQLEAQAEQRAKEAQAERTLAKVVERIRQTFEIEKIFEIATQEVRRLLNVERVTIYKFREDYFGDFVTESESGGWPKLVGSGWEDPYLNEHQGGRFRNNEPLIVDDIFNGGLTDCHVEALDYFGVKSCMVVSIFQGTKLWGLLSAFQHTGPRHWEENEVKLLTQVGAQLGIALQQGEYLTKLQEQSAQLAKTAELERAASKIIANVRQSLDIDTIFKTTSREVRQLLKADRVGVYR
ncbi:MAG TPA: GAF domain-containing protein, partial [Cyanophyceae cyanobacterium]